MCLFWWFLFFSLNSPLPRYSFYLGLICLRELQRLLHLKSYPWLYPTFRAVLFFSYLRFNPYATLVLLLITIFVNLFLVKDLMIGQ